ncbi:MAG: MoxR family ATPase [Anaerolineales bacterium]|nr:MoxR family ATPase [Anaerolineales bacterium]
MTNRKQPDWYLYRGQPSPEDPSPKLELPPPPPWRDFSNRERRRQRGLTFRPRDNEIRMVNAALYLRRPLLITGLPGTGKSSLAFAVAEALGLGEVLEWPITSRSQLKDGLYSYDAIGRLQDSNLTPGGSKEPPPIENYIRLGPLGSAFADSHPNQPRVLLIDEIDKSDIDLPNDLLNIFEEGQFVIPELARHVQQMQTRVEGGKTDEGRMITPQLRLDRPRSTTAVKRVPAPDGIIHCEEFPFVVLTSNGERELPAAFLRRCLRLRIEPPKGSHFRDIVRAHFQELAHPNPLPPRVEAYIAQVEQQYTEKKSYVPTDQLLNAIHMVLNEVVLEEPDLAEGQESLAQQILRALG